MPSSEDILRLQGQPKIEQTASPDAPPDYASQATDQLPIAFLPSYSIDISYWWEEAVTKVFRTSFDFGLIALAIKFIPLSDPEIRATLLAERRKGWLDAFLAVLCQDKAVDVPLCDSSLSMAEAIVNIISRRPHSPRWDSDWLVSALLDSDISTVAERLDIQIHSVFCTITYADWIAWCCGYQNDIVSNFLVALLSCRDRLIQLAQQDRAFADKLVLLRNVRDFLSFYIMYH
jgi:hypothetical protein